MANFNKVILIGNLTRDPELRYTKSDKAVVSFSLGVASGWGDNETTSWCSFTAWEKQAEAIAKFFKKGDKILIDDSELVTRTWDKDGETQYKVEYNVRKWEFAESKRSSSEDEIPF